MREPFEYQETITTILKKLAKLFPDNVFKLSTGAWYHSSSSKTIDKLRYELYDECCGHVYGDSLEKVYKLKLEQLKNVE